jgi:YesN/AraC family two-component response regulator
MRDFLIVFFIGIMVTAILKFTVVLSTVNYLIATYLTIMIYFISFRFAFRPGIIIGDIKKNISSDKKYNKSSLSDEMKQDILIRIEKVMEEEKLYRDSLISLSKLSARISASSNHISQVINECMNQNFYEMLASYRIKDAEELMKKFTNYTIDEISIMVGYNSRTAFNNAFKKKLGKTPSEYLTDLK